MVNPGQIKLQHNSLSLKGFVDAYNSGSGRRNTATGTLSSNVKAASQVMLKAGKGRVSKAVACPPDESVITCNNKTMAVRDFTSSASNASNQPHSRAKLKKRRSQEDSSTRRLILPGSLASEQPAALQTKVIKCQLNKGIRALLKKSKSQTRA